MTSTIPTVKYHRDAYQFVFAALRFTQQQLDRVDFDVESPDAHISGRELLEGIRELAIQQFGLMAITVFQQWGIESTEDIGRIVFELVERGDMRKTDDDQLSDFIDVYDFKVAFDLDYKISTAKAFRTH